MVVDSIVIIAHTKHQDGARYIRRHGLGSGHSFVYDSSRGLPLALARFHCYYTPEPSSLDIRNHL